MSVSEPMRMQYHVVRWDRDKQRGYIADRTGYEYLVTRANLAQECEGQIVEGDLVSGVAIETTVGDILIERGSNPIRERKDFSSEGVAPLGSWEPRSGTPQKFGSPGTGRFSHPRESVIERLKHE